MTRPKIERKLIHMVDWWWKDGGYLGVIAFLLFYQRLVTNEKRHLCFNEIHAEATDRSTI